MNMKAIQNAYTTRPIRFIEIYQLADWQIKIYSISVKNEFVQTQVIENAKQHLVEWLENANLYPLATYNIATLILHEGREGCFAIINWWIDDNMLQQFVYFAPYDKLHDFALYSDKGIITCVWEMAVLWFERNAWVEHVLKKAKNPDFETYLQAQFNTDI